MKLHNTKQSDSILTFTTQTKNSALARQITTDLSSLLNLNSFPAQFLCQGAYQILIIAYLYAYYYT